MKIQPTTSGGNISFKSGYPTFGSSGHLSYNPSVYENTNPFYKPRYNMTTNKGDQNISFKGSPWNRNNMTFKGHTPIHHIPTGCELGSRKHHEEKKVPQDGGILVYRHIDMLGNVIDIKA